MAGDLERSAALFQRLGAELEAGDVPAATATLVSLQAATGSARARTSDGGWNLATKTPRLGDDIAAIAAVAAVLDGLARDVLPALVATADSVSSGSLVPRAGRVELTALAATGPRLTAADLAVRQARDRIDAMGVDGLDGRLRSRILELRTHLREVAAVTATLARAATLLPPMLGLDGRRTYLVMFQNLAEVRATGGLPGAYVVLSADRGAVEILEQDTAVDGLGVFDAPVLPLDPAMTNLYSHKMGTFPGDVNFTAHFPTTAKLIREMYRLRSGRTVDGVIATDPVALSYLLRATGPIAMPDGPPLTAENVVRTVLSDAYARLSDYKAQDRYFARVARTVFDTLVGFDADPRALLGELARAAGERRLLVWSSRDDEQQKLVGTVLEGAMPADDAAVPNVGVFLNDGTGAKLGYYLRPATELSVGACRADGRRDLGLRVTLGSEAPPSGLSDYVVGLALAGPYVVRTNVLVFAPTGGAIRSARINGEPVAMGTGVERGRNVAVLTLDLPPGASSVIDVSLLTGDARSGPPVMTPQLWTTPTAKPWPTTVIPGPRCG